MWPVERHVRHLVVTLETQKERFLDIRSESTHGCELLRRKWRHRFDTQCNDVRVKKSRVAYKNENTHLNWYWWKLVRFVSMCISTYQGTLKNRRQICHPMLTSTLFDASLWIFDIGEPPCRSPARQMTSSSAHDVWKALKRQN